MHANINNAPNKVKGALNKAIGVVEGVADMEYFYATTCYFFEFKVEGDTQSDKQKEFQRQVEAQGGTYHIVRNFEYFKWIVLQIHANAFAL